MATINTTLSSFALVALTAAAFGIAASAIATECFDKNPSFKESKKDNYIFIIVNLVCNIFLVLISLISMYMSLRGN